MISMSLLLFLLFGFVFVVVVTVLYIFTRKSGVAGLNRVAAFHGNKRLSFEGWYYRCLSPSGENLALIPAIYCSPKGNQAFVQIFFAKRKLLLLQRLPASDFVANSFVFDATVGKSHFTLHNFSLHVETEQGSVEGDIELVPPLAPWPVTKTSMGCMGWMGRVPLMQCYHGVLSFTHSLRGSLRVTLPGESFTVDFTGGKGYLEKDWGTVFPKGWIWLQTNHFVSEQQYEIEEALESLPRDARPRLPEIPSFLASSGPSPSADMPPPPPRTPKKGAKKGESAPEVDAAKLEAFQKKMLEFATATARASRSKPPRSLDYEFQPLGTQALALAPKPPSDASFVFSIATVPLPIPILGRFLHAKGYFAGLHFGGRTVAMGLYTWQCKITKMRTMNTRLDPSASGPTAAGSGQDFLLISMETGEYRLSIGVHAPEDILQQPLLYMPTPAGFEPLLHESLEGTIRIRLWERVPIEKNLPEPAKESLAGGRGVDLPRGSVVKRWRLAFSGVGRHAGIEFYNIQKTLGLKLGSEYFEPPPLPSGKSEEKKKM